MVFNNFYKNNKMITTKKIIVIISIFCLVLLTACSELNSSQQQPEQNLQANMVTDGALDETIKPDEDDLISFTLFNNNILTIPKDRTKSDAYGVGRVDNRWTLDETDAILESIKGTWEIGEYVGFVSSALYYYLLFDGDRHLEQDLKDDLYNRYELKMANAKNNIPDVYFSVMERNGREVKGSYIYVNGYYCSPISIILSPDRVLCDNYPVFVDATTISKDFFAEYPVIYIKFFIEINEYNKYDEYKYQLKFRYEPATLVMTSDSRFYVLIDGAFYSLKEKIS